jgi:hypothetical protein
MMLRGQTLVLLVLMSLVAATRVPACSLCGANLRQSPTIRQEAAQDTAKMILICTVPKQDRTGEEGTTTLLAITDVLRSDPLLGKRKTLSVRQYPAEGSRLLVFCDVYKNTFDAYRGVELKTDTAVEYARKVIKLDPRDRVRQLLFYANYLENPDSEVARDAFTEFAKATDQEIAQAARKLSADKLRKWVDDKQGKIRSERLGLYCLLLGVCGGDEDARRFERMLADSNERVVRAYDGILCGYIHLRPRDGWQQTYSVLADGSKPLDLRLAAARTVSFFYGSQPKESRAQVLRCLRAMVLQSDLADIAVEDLRRWQIWDHTAEVLALFGKKGYESPLMQRAVLRYAMSSKDERCKAFLEERRRDDPDTVKEVEDGLQYEK